MANSVVLMSSILSRRVLELEKQGLTMAAREVMTEWSMWRDTLSSSDVERCVWAFVAAQSTLSGAAMMLLKEQKPGIYKIYVEVNKGQ